MNQFRITYNHFIAALEGESYQSYPEWMLIPDDFKAAALYIRFYDQITLAWQKTKKPFMEAETAISTLMQYLIKNVEIIKGNCKRYTPNYIYKVAFNAFYPLGKIKRDIDEWTHRRSIYEVDLEFESQYDERDCDNLYYMEPYILSKFFTDDTYFLDDNNLIWAVIEACDETEKKVIESLISDKKLGKRLSRKSPEIISKLKIKLKRFY